MQNIHKWQDCSGRGDLLVCSKNHTLEVKKITKELWNTAMKWAVWLPTPCPAPSALYIHSAWLMYSLNSRGREEKRQLVLNTDSCMVVMSIAVIDQKKRNFSHLYVSLVFCRYISATPCTKAVLIIVIILPYVKNINTTSMRPNLNIRRRKTLLKSCCFHAEEVTEQGSAGIKGVPRLLSSSRSSGCIKACKP